jgi:hypothetical protein
MLTTAAMVCGIPGKKAPAAPAGHGPEGIRSGYEHKPAM